MTLAQVRDAMAEMVGWRRWEDYTDFGQKTGWAIDHRQFIDPSHPIPASLDWLVLAWPEGWSWYRGWSPNCWTAQLNGRPVISGLHVSDANDVSLGLFTLLLKVAEWLRDNDPPAYEAWKIKAHKVLEEMRW